MQYFEFKESTFLSQRNTSCKLSAVSANNKFPVKDKHTTQV